MDLRAYYTKIREVEALLEGDHHVVVSLATPEGGKPGVLTEVPRAIAAKLIAEGRARVASDEEKNEFFDGQRAARDLFEEAKAVRQMQVVVMPKAVARKPKERK